MEVCPLMVIADQAAAYMPICLMARPLNWSAVSHEGEEAVKSFWKRIFVLNSRKNRVG